MESQSNTNKIYAEFKKSIKFEQTMVNLTVDTVWVKDSFDTIQNPDK